jgi:hypothetical protein
MSGQALCRIVDSPAALQIYSMLPKPRSECNKLEQLGVSAVAGYVAGVFCAVVSHPADTMVSIARLADGKLGAWSNSAVASTGLQAQRSHQGG